MQRYRDRIQFLLWKSFPVVWRKRQLSCSSFCFTTSIKLKGTSETSGASKTSSGVICIHITRKYSQLVSRTCLWTRVWSLVKTFVSKRLILLKYESDWAFAEVAKKDLFFCWKLTVSTDMESFERVSRTQWLRLTLESQCHNTAIFQPSGTNYIPLGHLKSTLSKTVCPALFETFFFVIAWLLLYRPICHSFENHIC